MEFDDPEITPYTACEEIPATGERKADVHIEHSGKVTSHRVTYSHHPDGRAHFSQDGKIFTAIKRQSRSLDTQNGHMFTLCIQGLHALDVAKTAKDAEGISVNRSAINFHIEQTPEAIKLHRPIETTALIGHVDGSLPSVPSLGNRRLTAGKSLHPKT